MDPPMHRRAPSADHIRIVEETGYDAYPAICCFPGCTQAARRADDGEDSLCAEHERLRYYLPDEFAREWSELAPSG